MQREREGGRESRRGREVNELGRELGKGKRGEEKGRGEKTSFLDS